jgi:putative transposase
MGLRRASHAVYDTTYLLVWCPKYRKKVFEQEDIRERADQLIQEICEEYGIEIEEMEVTVDHIHILASFPPRYSIGEVIRIIKSNSARGLFREFPKIKKKLWSGELWEDVGKLSINTLNIIETLKKGLRSSFELRLRCPAPWGGEFHYK